MSETIRSIVEMHVFRQTDLERRRWDGGLEAVEIDAVNTDSLVEALERHIASGGTNIATAIGTPQRVRSNEELCALLPPHSVRAEMAGLAFRTGLRRRERAFTVVRCDSPNDVVVIEEIVRALGRIKGEISLRHPGATCYGLVALVMREGESNLVDQDTGMATLQAYYEAEA